MICLLAKCGKDSPVGSLPSDDSAVSWQGEQSITKPMVNNKPAIAIPGIKEIIFTAGDRKQKVNFYNPKENDCYFQMNLYAEDKLIWKSGYVSPGNGYYNIELNRTFSTGTLQGFLLIKCYKQDGTELNSAKVKFQITVI